MDDLNEEYDENENNKRTGGTMNLKNSVGNLYESQENLERHSDEVFIYEKMINLDLCSKQQEAEDTVLRQYNELRQKNIVFFINGRPFEYDPKEQIY